MSENFNQIKFTTAGLIGDGVRNTWQVIIYYATTLTLLYWIIVGVDSILAPTTIVIDELVRYINMELGVLLLELAHCEYEGLIMTFLLTMQYKHKRWKVKG